MITLKGYISSYYTLYINQILFILCNQPLNFLMHLLYHFIRTNNFYIFS